MSFSTTRALAAGLLILAPAVAQAAQAPGPVQIGTLQVESSIGQPLSARAPVIPLETGWLGHAPSARLLPELAYWTHQLNTPQHPLQDLRATITRTDDGTFWIKLSSGLPVSAPDMHLLVQIRGRSEAVVESVDVALAPAPAATPSQAPAPSPTPAAHAGGHRQAAALPYDPLGWIVTGVVMLTALAISYLSRTRVRTSRTSVASITRRQDSPSGSRQARQSTPAAGPTESAAAAATPGASGQARPAPRLRAVTPATPPAADAGGTPLALVPEAGLDVEPVIAEQHELPRTDTNEPRPRPDPTPAELRAAFARRPKGIWAGRVDAAELSRIYQQAHDFSRQLEALDSATGKPSREHPLFNAAGPHSDFEDLARFYRNPCAYESAITRLYQALADGAPDEPQPHDEPSAEDESRWWAELPRTARDMLAEIALIVGKSGGSEHGKWLLDHLRFHPEPDSDHDTKTPVNKQAE